MVYFGIDEIDFPTPDWIRAHCVAHGGGWFHAIPLTAEHPLVVEGARCDHHGCGDPFLASERAIVMPFSGLDEGKWIMEHFECSMSSFAFSKEQLAGLRPLDYKTLPSHEQWVVDKRLGIIGYDPDAKTALGEALAKALAATKK
jgi:hypothetical protein